jgi:DNA helicase-2/ATP-dependent DNA helicase PcrA
MAVREFNPQQAEVIATRDGAVCVDACAGTGKTAAIVERYARMIADGADPHRLLLLTFTVKAANEMAERIQHRTGLYFPWATNFHKLCVKLLRYYPALGVPPGFSIIDADDQKSIVKRVARHLDIETPKQVIKDILAQIERSRLVRLGYRDPEDETLAATSRMPSIRAIAEGYERVIAHENKLDFDSIIQLTLAGMKRNPGLAAHIASRWTHVTVDEAQDMDRAQFELIGLLGPHGNVCLVGDMDQGIYGFRGAEWANLRRFIEQRGAIRIPLEINYRSSAEILAVANAVISENVDRYPKTMRDTLGGGGDVRIVVGWDSEKEALWATQRIQQKIRSGVSPSECAVLYRVGGLSRSLEQAFARNRVPYRVVGGLRFWERREVKDVLAYARVLIGLPDPESWRRATQTPSIGLGDKGWGTVLSARTPEDGIERTARGKARDWINGVRNARAIGSDWKALDGLLNMVGYRESLGREEDGKDRLSNVDETLNAMSEFPSIQEFLDEAMLGLPGKDDDGDKDCVTLSTIHGAKGLEWTHVHVLGCNDGVLPHMWSQGDAMAMEEERRLFYVAVTRAKRSLVLSYADRTMRDGRWSTAMPSPFLDALDPLKLRVERA